MSALITGSFAYDTSMGEPRCLASMSRQRGERHWQDANGRGSW